MLSATSHKRPEQVRVASENFARSRGSRISCLPAIWPLLVALPMLTGCGTHSVLASQAPGAVVASTPVTSAPANGYTWVAPAVGAKDSLGTIELNVNGQAVTLLTPVVKAVSGTITVVAVSSSLATSGQTLTLSLADRGQPLTVTLALQQTGDVLSVNVNADKPLIAKLDPGSWNAQLQSRSISVPYYKDGVYYLAGLQNFANTWWDWHTSTASKVSQGALLYQPRTDGTYNVAHESLSLSVATNIADVFPAISNPPSPYLKQLAGRLVVDLVDEAKFEDIASGMQLLGSSGVSNCVALVHWWQNQGYDNALPEHYPAMSALGGDAALKDAVASAKSMGCLTGVHQNYTDYYPNYPGFTPKALALLSNGDWFDTWLNAEQIEAHEAKPSWMVPNAQTQSPQIHSRYGTNASFVDVNSAVTPWARSDWDAAIPGAGTSALWMSNAEALWTYERSVESGPVFGEGADHWYYSGLLDGVEAQIGGGATVTQQLGENNPLFVDFDLLRMHPLQVNHGMGYYERWTPLRTTTMTTAQSDAYRMQEIAFGHAPYVGRQYWDDLNHVLVENYEVSPVAASYGATTASSIQYQVSGAWVSTNVAATSNLYTKVHVTYSNGLEVVANSDPENLVWNGLTIPQYGWAAKGTDGLLAYTAMCGNSLCDYAETTTSVYANARNQADTLAQGAFAAVSLTSFQQAGTDKVSMSFKWDCYRPFAGTYSAFVHIVDDSQLNVNAGIVAQVGYNTSTSTWIPGESIASGPVSITLPASLPDGRYSIRVGLWDRSTGLRVKLAGLDDGYERYTIGYIVVQGGKTYTFSPVASQPDPRMNATGNVVSFGTVETNGMLSVRQEKGSWVLRPFPAGKSFVVRFNSTKFPMPATVTSNDTNKVLTPIPAGGFWELNLGGGTQYSWPVQ